MNAVNPFEGAPIIHSYTRAQAIADGVLFDATALAAEAGFKVPVALTSAAWADAVAWSAENASDQDEVGRLWDVLTMARHSIGRSLPLDRAEFQVIRIPNSPTAEVPILTDLVLHIGPGDQGEPVVTILRPSED